MAKYAHPDALDGGLLFLKNNITKMLLVSNYTLGDSYATVQAAKLTEVTMTSTDFTLASSGNNRTLTVATGKTSTLTAAATGSDAHIAFTDGTARVLWVTDETSNPTGSIGSLVTFSGPVFTTQQPT